MTEAEIISFQKTHCDWYGKPLKPDGQCGPKTQWAIDIAGLPTWRQNIIRLSLSELAKDIIESPIGSNRGLEIDKYITWCGLDPKIPKQEGFRWCAASASFALSAGSRPIRISSVYLLSQSMFPTDHPLPGDLAYSLRPDRTGHCGILFGIDDDYAMINEGNCDNRMKLVRRFRKTLEFASLENTKIIPRVGMDIPLLGAGARTI